MTTLALKPHPEGGWFRQTYRSAVMVETARGMRAASTGIYFLLREGEFSALHRIASDEVWHFYLGSSLRVESLGGVGGVESVVLGSDVAAGEVLQASVPAGRWFGASLVRGGAGWWGVRWHRGLRLKILRWGSGRCCWGCFLNVGRWCGG